MIRLHVHTPKALQNADSWRTTPNPVRDSFRVGGNWPKGLIDEPLQTGCRRVAKTLWRTNGTIQ